MLLIFQVKVLFTGLFGARTLLLLAPEMILALCAVATLVMEVVLPRAVNRWTAHFALISIALAASSLFLQWLTNSALLPLEGFYGMVRLDGFALLLQAIFLITAASTIAISIRYLDVENEQRGEFYALVLFATTAMMLLACGYDLLVLYISLELMAVAFYVLVAFTKRERRANEAAMKYFLLGAFSSGILLYGLSLIYGATGSTDLGQIAERISATLPAATAVDQVTTMSPSLLLLGMTALAAGLFFKIAAVPFHMWAPDIYEGAPTPVTAFLSTGSKAVSFALFARIFIEAFGGLRSAWVPLLGAVAAITISVSNWAAITQENSKRLLAYSAIANAGYLLLGLIAGNNYGYMGFLIYLLVYVLMNIGAFGVIISLRQRSVIGDRVDDFVGLAHKAPSIAFAMTVFMLSLGGLPATGGFIGKYFFFGGLIQRGDVEGARWYY